MAAYVHTHTHTHRSTHSRTYVSMPTPEQMTNAQFSKCRAKFGPISSENAHEDRATSSEDAHEDRATSSEDVDEDRPTNGLRSSSKLQCAAV